MADLSGRMLVEFMLREQIDEGGCGAVYRGEQWLLERDVVVKVLHAWRHDDVSRQRFLREAKLASRLEHRYAAHVYASGVEAEDGLLWIAMELVHGVPFAPGSRRVGRCHSISSCRSSSASLTWSTDRRRRPARHDLGARAARRLCGAARRRRRVLG